MHEPLPGGRESHIRKYVRLEHEEVVPKQPPTAVPGDVHPVLVVPLFAKISPKRVAVLAVELGKVRERPPSSRSRRRRARRAGTRHVPRDSVGLGPHVHDRTVEESTGCYLPRDVPWREEKWTTTDGTRKRRGKRGRARSQHSTIPHLTPPRRRIRSIDCEGASTRYAPCSDRIARSWFRTKSIRIRMPVSRASIFRACRR
jgi:hypothetical protein